LSWTGFRLTTSAVLIATNYTIFKQIVIVHFVDIGGIVDVLDSS